MSSVSGRVKGGRIDSSSSSTKPTYFNSSGPATQCVPVTVAASGNGLWRVIDHHLFDPYSGKILCLQIRHTGFRLTLCEHFISLKFPWPVASGSAAEWDS